MDAREKLELDNMKSTHRKLDERTAIFTCIGIGRKSHLTKKDLNLQMCFLIHGLRGP